MASCIGVMLGVPDEMISSEDDRSNVWTTNKFGGVPNWMNKVPVDHPQCNVCGHDLPMVAQIYCPLEDSSYDRVLYVFGCVNRACWNTNQSWKVLRSQLLVENAERKGVRQVNEKEEIWCDEADDWGEEGMVESDNNELKKLEEQTENLNLGGDIEFSNQEPEHETSNYQETGAKISNTLHFVPYYVTVIEESYLGSEATALTRSEKRLLDEYTAKEGVRDIDELMDGDSKGDWRREKYELGVAKHGDKTFQKFKKKLRLCPEQCLRYCWNGQPLPMTSQGFRAVPPCNSCGEKRVFELQLMPALVSLLRIDGETYKEDFSSAKTTPNSSNQHSLSEDKELCDFWPERIEFGTVFIYTCSQGCWREDARHLEEYVIVHSDPDQDLFKSER